MKIYKFLEVELYIIKGVGVRWDKTVVDVMSPRKKRGAVSRSCSCLRVE